jgi:hypothetical protein
MDLPYWASHPVGKLITQFHSYSYNQTAFLWREVFKPAVKGNVAPMMRWLMYGLPTAAALYETQSVLRGKGLDTDPMSVAGGAVQKLGGGILGDLAQGLWPRSTSSQGAPRDALRALNSLLGPTMGTFTEGYMAVDKAVHGDTNDLKRFGSKQVPVVGPTIANVAFPFSQPKRKNQSIESMIGGGASTPRSALEAYIDNMGR